MTLRQSDSVSHAEEAPGRRSAQSRFRPDIEGLRAVAVVAVVLFHADVPGVGGGFVGVDVFFVISGYLITGLLWREVSTIGTSDAQILRGPGTPTAAGLGHGRRYHHDWLGCPVTPATTRTVIVDGIASALYVSNYWFIQQGVDYFGGMLPQSPFQHYWSLGVEEQFYLIWPPLIIGTAWLVRRMRRRTNTGTTSSQRPFLVVLALVAAASFALSLAVTHVAPPVAFFSLPTRAWQLAAGGLVALTASQWRRLRTTCRTHRMGRTRGDPGSQHPVQFGHNVSGYRRAIANTGRVLVIGAGCATPSQGCGRVLGSSPMRAIGRISYSWYLWHWPVLLLAPALLGHSLGLAARLTAALISGALAVLTLRFIENPLRFADPVAAPRGPVWHSAVWPPR